MVLPSTTTNQDEQFWKQFFEASANISLTGYEEPNEQDESQYTQTSDGAEEGDSQAIERPEESISTAEGERPKSRLLDEVGSSELLDSPSVTVDAAGQKTPKAKAATAAGLEKEKARRDADGEDTSSFAKYTSPFEDLKRDMEATSLKDTQTQGVFFLMLL